ncbi:serine protease [Streptomyces sp. NBC_01498]|uniref:VMAP-C domain-containing protein n=1 Tax=Streptomyces sp. NBC_01498 TaxID=2975870 RepID=UPI002E7B675B|nr:trypsin-like peptidase domain-containing protein [Streptomyces sp. NBC_01498]WTL24680.1 serine protease [Streptomyces sp. NBC_01498]
MSSLEDPVSRGVVRIGPGGSGYDRGSAGFWGSGFFVAPEWVVTCAHVVDKRVGAMEREPGGPVTVTTYDDDRLEGEIARVLTGHDLALVRVPGAGFADCLWLSDRSAATPAEVELYGWAQTSGAYGGEEFLSTTAMATGGRRRNPMWLQNGLVLHGCSGGPVIDARHGSVIGVIKGKGQGDATIGRAESVTALRTLGDQGADSLWTEVLAAHDRHHLRRFEGSGDCWPRLHTRLAAAYGQPHSFTSQSRTQLYGLFADVEPPSGPGQVLHLVNGASRRLLRSPQRMESNDPRTWREGSGLLYDPREGTEAGLAGRDLEQEAVVLYAAMVYATLRASRDTPGAGRLRDWVEKAANALETEVIREESLALLAGDPEPKDERYAERHPAPNPGPDRAGGPVHDDVLVVIEPEVYGTHPWRVQLLDSDGGTTTVRYDEEGVPRSGLEAAVRQGLSEALARADAGQYVAAVDFLLPRALFDEPVDEWRSRLPRADDPPSVHTLPIGRRRVVALRDQLRRRDGVTPEWNRGRRATDRGPLVAVPLCLDVPDAGHSAAAPEGEEAAYARLSVSTAGVTGATLPVYCASTATGRGSRVLTRAFHAGHVAVLFRRTGEDGHDDCAEFYREAARLVHDVPTGDALRERVRVLRNRGADPDQGDRETAWARHLVLIYDPPHRPALPDEPLRAPRS